MHIKFKFDIVTLYSVFLAFSTLLNMYKTPLPGITLGELCQFVFICIFIFKSKLSIKKSKAEFILLIMTIYIIVYSIILLTIGKSNFEELFRTLRFSFYYMTVCFFIRDYVDIKIFKLWVKRIAYVSVAFLLLQYFLFYVTNKVQLGFYQPFMYVQSYREGDYIYKFSHAFRPSSFFAEPAQLSQFLCLPLIFSLYDEEKEDWKSIIVCVLGMILSTSAQSLLFLFVIFVIYIVRKTILDFKNGINKKHIWIRLGFIILILIVLTKFMSTELFKNEINRLTNMSEEAAIYARLNVYTYAFNKGNLFTQIFGNGYGALAGGEGIFVPGFVHVFYGIGLIGISLTFAFFIKLFMNGNIVAKSMVICFMIMFFGASIFMNMAFIPISILMMYDKDYSDKKLFN